MVLGGKALADGYRTGVAVAVSEADDHGGRSRPRKLFRPFDRQDAVLGEFIQA